MKFVVLAAPRTGSNWLCTLLNSHPEVLCHHELFNPRGIFYALDHRNGGMDLGSLEERDRRPLEFLARVWRAGGGARCVGFKMTRGQADDVLSEVARDADVTKIVLRRRNRVATFVSHLIAERTDRWEVYEPGRIDVEPVRVSVRRDALEAYTAHDERFYRELDAAIIASESSCLETEYERLGEPHEHERILAFLGVRPTPGGLTSGSVRQRRHALVEVIENYAELEEALQGSAFHAELLEN